MLPHAVPVRHAPLLAILVLAAALRLFQLGEIPRGFSNDEAAHGYDAYSLLKTGCDRLGVRAPLFPRCFGEYNEGSLHYLIVPFVAVLGSTELAVRLPVALVGILTVFLLYLMVRAVRGRDPALWAALFLAISPWHVQLSRIGFRAILMPCCLLLGLWLFERARRRPALLILSALAFALTLYTYSSARVFVPIFVLGLCWVHADELRQMKGWAWASGAVFLGVLAALFSFWITPTGMAYARLRLDMTPVHWVANYLSYFSFDFLFRAGEEMASFGYLHLFEVLTVPAGLILVARGWRDRANRVLLLWLVLYPIPAALTAPNAVVRAIVGTPLFAILSAVAVTAVRERLRDERARFGLNTGLAFVITAGVLWFGSAYFHDYAEQPQPAWNYGMREAIRLAEQSDHDLVQISDSYTPGEVYVLFYTRFPPEEYHRLLREGRDLQLGRYTCRITREQLMNARKLLLILRPEDDVRLFDLPGVRYETRSLGHISYPSGLPAIGLMEVNLVRDPPDPPRGEARSIL